MDLINRIGQRKFAKIIFGFSMFVSIINYIIRYYSDYGAIIESFFIKALLGVILLSLPIGLLTLTAHKTREFRMFCIFASAGLLVMNTIFFHLHIDLLYIILSELVVTSLFYGYIVKHEKDRKIHEKRLKGNTKVTHSIEKETQK